MIGERLEVLPYTVRQWGPCPQPPLLPPLPVTPSLGLFFEISLPFVSEPDMAIDPNPPCPPRLAYLQWYQTQATRSAMRRAWATIHQNLQWIVIVLEVTGSQPVVIQTYSGEFGADLTTNLSVSATGFKGV